MTGQLPQERPLGNKGAPLILVHLELLLVVAIWAGTFVSTKIVLEQIPPAISALYRYLIASLIIMAIDMKNRERIDRADFPALLLLGLTGVTLYYLLQHYGIRYTDATEAAILISLSPVFIGLISWPMTGERLKLPAGVGLILAFAGSLLVITDGRVPSPGQLGLRVHGDFLILLTALTWAVYSVYGKKLLHRYRPVTLIKYTTVTGTLLLVPFTLPEIIHYGLPRPDMVGWLNLLYLGGAASVYGYLAWYRALMVLPAVTVGSFLYFRPLLTGIIAALILHESIGPVGLAGGVLVILGTFLTAKK